MKHTHSALIKVKNAGKKGRGVFAMKKIRKGTVIETVPMVIFDYAEVFGRTGSTLSRYVFAWGEGKVAIALGYGSLYNHSFRANAYYTSSGSETLTFVASRKIDAGEEITINYNSDSNVPDSLSFAVIE